MFIAHFIRTLAAAGLLIGTVDLATAGGPYGVPVGTLTVATVEAPLLQTRVGYPYTVSSYAATPNGQQKDPHGAIGVARSYQNRVPGTAPNPPSYTPATAIPLPINCHDWPSNSGLEKTRSYGPFTPGDDHCVPETFGRETVTLDYVDGTGKHFTLDTKYILIYPASAYAQVYNALAPPLTALSAAYTGDPPRALVQLNNVYPGAQSWVVIAPGTTAPPSPKIPNTLFTAPQGDLGSAQVYLELGTLATTSGQAYTVQAYQQTAAYGVEPFYSSATNHDAVRATFTVDLHFNVNAEVGTSK